VGSGRCRVTAPALPRPTGSEPCRRAPDRWFGSGITDKQAAQMCHGCPIINECGAYGIAYLVEGLWGGLTEKGRERYRKKNHITPVSLASNTNAAYRTVDHGTEAGAAAHRRRYERVCPPCHKAELLARTERKEARVG
jgi:hypothetical protein